jgi:hypothetical protein
MLSTQLHFQIQVEPLELSLDTEKTVSWSVSRGLCRIPRIIVIATCSRSLTILQHEFKHQLVLGIVMAIILNNAAKLSFQIFTVVHIQNNFVTKNGKPSLVVTLL